jgi:hypothetical protein
MSSGLLFRLGLALESLRCPEESLGRVTPVVVVSGAQVDQPALRVAV